MKEQERWKKLYRDYHGNPLTEGEVWVPVVVMLFFVVLHVIGIRWWVASGLKSRPAYWLTVSWKIIPLIVLGWLFEIVPALLELPVYLVKRGRGLKVRTLDRRQVPVVPEYGAFRLFIKHDEPAAWPLDESVEEWRKRALAKRTDLRCSGCGALWLEVSQAEGACFACKAKKPVLLAVFIPVRA